MSICPICNDKVGSELIRVCKDCKEKLIIESVPKTVKKKVKKKEDG